MTTGYRAFFLISIDRIPFLASTFDNADPLFALVITSAFYLYHLQDPLGNQDLATGIL